MFIFWGNKKNHPDRFMERNFDKQVERNLVGIQLEKQGKIEDAIKLYEENIKKNFQGYS